MIQILEIDLRKSKSKDIQILTLSGEFDFSEKNRVDSYLSRVLSDVPKGLIVDLCGISLLDSSGVGLLMAYFAELKDAGTNTAIVACQNNYLLQKLRNLGVFGDAGIRIFGSVNEAEDKLL